MPLLRLLLGMQFCRRFRKRWEGGDEFAQSAMKSLSELHSEEVVRGVREDEGRQAGAQPLGDDGSPVVDPGLDEVQIVAADQAQERMAAGHGTAERRMRPAAMGFVFGLGGGRRGEQGSAVDDDHSFTVGGPAAAAVVASEGLAFDERRWIVGVRIEFVRLHVAAFVAVPADNDSAVVRMPRRSSDFASGADHAADEQVVATAMFKVVLVQSQFLYYFPAP